LDFVHCSDSKKLEEKNISKTGAVSMGPNRVGVSPHLRTETDPVSETCFSSNYLASGRWTKSKNPVIFLGFQPKYRSTRNHTAENNEDYTTKDFKICALYPIHIRVIKTRRIRYKIGGTCNTHRRNRKGT
jgi:hypothetical protein